MIAPTVAALLSSRSTRKATVNGLALSYYPGRFPYLAAGRRGRYPDTAEINALADAIRTAAGVTTIATGQRPDPVAGWYVTELLWTLPAAPVAAPAVVAADKLPIHMAVAWDQHGEPYSLGVATDPALVTKFGRRSGRRFAEISMEINRRK